MRRILPWMTVLAVTGAAASASAAGYDTPILYSARHIGMGGAAISFVSDPSAVFHNPAGLAHTRFIDITADFSPLIGLIKSSPKDGATSIDAKPTLAPFFNIAAAFRAYQGSAELPGIVFGIGAYPVASAGAEYEYTVTGVGAAGKKWVDRTKIAFIEVAPAIAFNFPGNLRLGAAYRMTILQFNRFQRATDVATGTAEKAMLDLKMLGTSFEGFKLGLQWNWKEYLSLGVVYRHKTRTTVKADSTTLFGVKYASTTMDFTLPSRLGFGVRGDYYGFGLALDVEYGFQSQNVKSTIKTKNAATGAPFEVPNWYQWKDAWTVRVGGEYGFLERYKVRLGYLWDGAVSNKQYPSAFGTPPAATNTLTAGFGAKFWKMEANIAYAYRWGPTTPITTADIKSATETCATCSKPGDYKIQMHGIYVDTSIYF